MDPMAEAGPLGCGSQWSAVGPVADPLRAIGTYEECAVFPPCFPFGVQSDEAFGRKLA
jgi:hypothetical protein